MKARVHIRLKAGVLDPEGEAIARALRGLGFAGVGAVRTGKLLELDLAQGDPARAEDELRSMCEKLLANTVIERYDIEIEP